MLEHLSGIVSSALQVSGGPTACCDHPTEDTVTHHRRVVDALVSGESAVAESAMRQVLGGGGESVAAAQPAQGAPAQAASGQSAQPAQAAQQGTHGVPAGAAQPGQPGGTGAPRAGRTMWCPPPREH